VAWSHEGINKGMKDQKVTGSRVKSQTFQHVFVLNHNGQIMHSELWDLKDNRRYIHREIKHNSI